MKRRWLQACEMIAACFVLLFLFHDAGIIIDRHKLSDLGTEYVVRDTVSGVWTSGGSWFTRGEFIRQYDRKYWHIEVIDTIAGEL